MRPLSITHFITAILLIISSSPLLSQEQQLTIRVVNAEDQEPVAFATISFPAQQYGFSANEEGLFKLPVEPSAFKRKIVISSIGFEPYESTLGELVSHNTSIIRLHPKVTVLQEVLVKAEAETPQTLMRKAEKNMKSFLGKDPYYLFGFYTESVKKNNKYAGYTEAYGVFHISGYQPGYNRKNRLFSYDLAQWKNMRRTQYTIGSPCNDGKRKLAIEHLIKAKSEYLYNGPFSTNRDQFRLTLDSATSYDNQDVFIVGFAPLSHGAIRYEGKAYIKADDYALLKLEVTDTDDSDLLYRQCTAKDISSHFVMTFTRVGEKYYLNNVQMTTTYLQGEDTVQENTEIAGGEFRENRVIRLNQDQRVVIYNEMLNPSIYYEPNFWEQQDREVAGEIREDLSKEESLRKQFLMTSGHRIIPLPDDYYSYEDLYKNHEALNLFLNGDF